MTPPFIFHAFPVCTFHLFLCFVVKKHYILYLMRYALVFWLLSSTASAFPTFHSIQSFKNIHHCSSNLRPAAYSSNGPTLTVFSETRPSKVLRRSKQQPEDEEEADKTWLDRFFDPIISKYAELPESDQSMLASIYQSAYFMLCVYIGIVMVKAYKHSIDNSGGIG